jgi:predicted esterase
MLAIERAIAVPIHGRYILEEPTAAAPWRLLVGFHGYAEAAEAQLTRLQTVRPADAWRRVSVQGLHRFYRGRTADVVASWMTKQDRELAIDDNVSYVEAVIGDVARAGQLTCVAFAGFSQGVAMAFRAAARSQHKVAGVIALGGDVPPELDARALANANGVLIGRGNSDQWYGPETLASDVGRLRAAGVNVQVEEFEGGHEWSEQFSRAAERFLTDHR